MLIALELRRLIRERESLLALMIAAALAFAGVWQGGGFAEQLRAKQRRAIEQEQIRMTDLKTKVADIESGRVAPDGVPGGDPRTAVKFALSGGAPMAVLPVRPLAGLAVGQSDLMPTMVRVKLTNRTTIFSGQEFIADEIVHPSELQAGHFDFAFVAVILLPLIALSLCFSLISAERESGSLALALAQPVCPRKIILTRLGLRWAALTAACLLPPVLYFASTGALSTAAGATGFLICALALAAYLAMWFALGLVVNRFGRSSAANAATLGAAWVVWVLVLPSLIDSISSTVSPPPSRAQLVVDLREAYNRLNRDAYATAEQFYLQHPELLQNALPPDIKMFYNRFYAIQQLTDDAIRPVLEAQDGMRMSHDAVSSSLSWLAPSLLLQQTLAAVAGTDPSRHFLFMQGVHRYRDHAREVLEPKVFGQQPLEIRDFDRLGAFEFADESASALLGRTALIFAVIASMAVILLAVGTSGMTRSRLLDSREQ